MILLDDDDQQGSSKLRPTPVPTLRLPERVAGRASLTLPDYETSQLEAQHIVSPSLHSVIFKKPSFPNRFDTRFWRVTFFALAIYVFLSIVVGIPIIVTRIAAHRPRPPPNLQALFLDDSDQVAGPLPVGGIMMAEATVCDAWDSVDVGTSQFTATVRHTLTPQGLFSFRSNATDEVVPRPGGGHNLTVDINDDASATQAVLVVTLTTSSALLREQTHMCFAPSGDFRGLSIYIPQGLTPTDMLAFDIRLLFPQSSQLITVSSLITYLPMFHQSFGYLSPAVRFQSISIMGAGVNIICDALQADKIGVKSSFASISGSFNVTQSLTLDNIGGSIYSNVTLNNDPSLGLPTYLVLDTGNSDIVTDVLLVAPKNARSPQYYGQVQTFNGTLAVNIAHEAATPPAVINLQVNNNQAKSTICLDSKYSGIYDLRTKLQTVTVRHPPATNPSGVVRTLDTDSNSTAYKRGWVGYGARPAYWNPMTNGQVLVSSSLSPILLELGA
ncbi:hypothetical protein B0H17DRAFT_1003344 [Mycena rosella]|uniref:Uncharacterized protein n=1 Tax=Mycena rosella TaxID=1033263 RepID=A0AAD7GRC8_MYCRO|nr:hypothetical protein B0H17DRAFT_1003344 [Mycena rosella]